MLSCTTAEELAQFKSDGSFSEREIKWVYNRLLTPLEREKVKKAASANQLLLLNQATEDKPQIEWVRYREETFLVSARDGDILALRQAGSNKSLHRVPLNCVEVGGYHN